MANLVDSDQFAHIFLGLLCLLRSASTCPDNSKLLNYNENEFLKIRQ